MERTHEPNGSKAREPIQRFTDLIAGIRVAMLTTVDERSHLRSCPMLTLQSEREDELWFYMDARSHLIDDLSVQHQVSLAYVDPVGNRYVSVSGIGHILRDSDVLARFWTPEIARLFPYGPDRDPHLALLRVQLEEVQCWDEATNRMVRLQGLARSDGPDHEPSVPPSRH